MSTNRIEVGILGATGMVGQHFIKFLQGNPWFDLKWLGASDRSAGKKYKDAMTWHLAGGTPDTVANQTVEECKPGTWWSPIRATIAWSRMCLYWFRKSIPTTSNWFPANSAPAAGRARSSPIRIAPPSAW